MKIMVPKEISMGDNLCIYNPFYMCCLCYAEKAKKYLESLTFLKKFSIGFNVGTFHRLFAIAGFAYLLYADFGKFAFTEF
jgi:hypothetical protein